MEDIGVGVLDEVVVDLLLLLVLLRITKKAVQRGTIFGDSWEAEGIDTKRTTGEKELTHVGSSLGVWWGYSDNIGRSVYRMVNEISHQTTSVRVKAIGHRKI